MPTTKERRKTKTTAAKTPTGKHGAYHPHPSVAMVAKSVAELKERSGRSLDEWIKLGKTKGPRDEPALAAWFKQAHGLGTNYASWLAGCVLGTNKEDGDEAAYLKKAPMQVDNQFAGGKASLRPIGDALLELCRSIGKEVRICPCATMIPAFRKHVIAAVKVPNRSAVHFELALRDAKPTKRLLDTGGFARKDRLTHRFVVTDVSQIDAELKAALKRAYDLDA
jgi:hypothetical protein